MADVSHCGETNCGKKWAFHVKMATVVSGLWFGNAVALYTEYLLNLTLVSNKSRIS